MFGVDVQRSTMSETDMPIDVEPWISSEIIFDFVSFVRAPPTFGTFDRKGCNKKTINTEIILQSSKNFWC